MQRDVLYGAAGDEPRLTPCHKARGTPLNVVKSLVFKSHMLTLGMVERKSRVNLISLFSFSSFLYVAIGTWQLVHANQPKFLWENGDDMNERKRMHKNCSTF